MGDEPGSTQAAVVESDAPPDAVPGVPQLVRRRGRRGPTVLAVLVPLALAVVLVAGAVIRVPYVLISPGQATALDGDVVTIDGAPTYQHSGEFLYLTVRVSNRDPNVYRYLFATLDDDITIEKREAVIGGCATYAQSQRLATLQMGQSQDVAKIAALRQLGYTVPDASSRVIVQHVVCDGPSRGVLEVGDVVTAVEGVEIRRSDELRPALAGRRPGQRVTVTVDRDGRRDVGVRLGVLRHEGTPRQTCARVRTGEAPLVGTPCVGVVVATDVRHDLPIEVTIDTERVSGPSAGLAFALALVDDLSPGELTGGRPVAVTGTIDAEGRVGPVGAVRQKAITARRQGARVMLVPRAEQREARAAAGSMKVVGVDTLADAITALGRAGGDPVTAPAGSRP